jgi:hypothetical protein
MTEDSDQRTVFRKKRTVLRGQKTESIAHAVKSRKQKSEVRE